MKQRFDLALTAGLVLLGLGVRLAFVASGPPAMVTTDSITYVQPAYDLATGQGFDLTLRRTAGYPLFLAAAFALTHVDLQAVAWLQHLLGVATVAATYWLGRLTLGRFTGLVGGLGVALSGPQLIYEHYLMTEALFTLLLVLGLLGLVVAARRNDARCYLLAGALLGLCAITRPIGQLFVALAPLVAILATRNPRRTVALTLVTALGFGAVLLPGMARNYVVGGSFTGSSALGKTLFGRITRHDDGMRFDLPPAGKPDSDPSRASARQVARQAAESDTSRGSLVHLQLMRDYGYTEAQAYNVMRDAALDVLLAQPGYWLSSSASGAVQLVLGQDEPLRQHFARLSGDRLRNDWREAGLGSLLPPEVRPEVRWTQHALSGAMSRLFEPSHWPFMPTIAVLFFAGALSIALRPAWRPWLFLPATVVSVIALSALLDGPVPRFRYPLDPVMFVVAAGGVAAIWELRWWEAPKALLARRGDRPARGASTVEPTAAGVRSDRGLEPS